MSLRITLFDDNKNIRESINMLIATVPGLEVVGSYSHVLDCIKDIKESKPDVVLMDLMMPGMDGFQVIQAMEADPTLANLPIIVVTAKDLDAQEHAWLTQRTVQCLSKSVAPSLMVNIIDQVLVRPST